MQYSYSRLSLLDQCLYRYKLRYIDKVKVYQELEPNNALLIGTMLHEALEIGMDKAEKNYYKNFNKINDLHINEVIKVREAIKYVDLPKRGVFEQVIQSDDFIGYMDYLVPVGEREYDLYDFKYSNNIQNYENSSQLSIYKYQYELTHPGSKIRDMCFIVVPKLFIRQKKDETVQQFRQRIVDSTKKPTYLKMEYNPNQVIDFYKAIKKEKEIQVYPKEPSKLCAWCEYEGICQEGENWMLLPSVERRTTENDPINRRIWIYGQPFSGKTTFANQFPNPLMLNTDGNIKFVDAPYISIKDRVEVTGRVTQTTLGWDVFKEVIDELEKKENEFDTIIVDLLEDMYLLCRQYIYKELNISHESDASFKAWDKVRSEFMTQISRLTMLPYENIILISHEDTSRDITKKNGDNVTSISPALQDKVSNKVAGMVDAVARVLSNEGNRYLDFKTDEVVFGGGRLSESMNTKIGLSYDDFVKAYDGAVKESREHKPEAETVEESKEERKEVK